MFEIAEEIDIFTIPAPEQNLSKFHLEEHSSKTRHEEEQNEQKLKQTSNISKNIEQFQKDAIVSNRLI